MSDQIDDLLRKYEALSMANLMLIFAASSQALITRGVTTADLKASLDAPGHLRKVPR